MALGLAQLRSRRCVFAYGFGSGSGSGFVALLFPGNNGEALGDPAPVPGKPVWAAGSSVGGCV